jgi:hypothetical protein
MDSGPVVAADPFCPLKSDPQPSPWDYGADAELRKVNCAGDIYVGNKPWMVSLALCSETVQIQRIEQRILVYFCNTCKGCPDNKV